jgi:predicted naringenin-chalcone synthase
MFIRGVGTAVPQHRYTQQKCWEAASRSPRVAQLTSRSQALLRKVLTSDNGIESRHFVIENLDEVFDPNPNKLHERFARSAPILAEEAARKALQEAGLDPSDIGALIISTCTGYLCPGLTSYVSEKLGLPANILLLDLVGHGCGAALPNLRTAVSLIEAGQSKHVLSVCVEICSAAFYLDNDPGVLISACLFGDGAGAAVISNEPGSGRRIQWKEFATRLNPQDRDLLRFEQRDGMLRNILDKSVPLLVVEEVAHVLRELNERAGVVEIAEWILHAGGRDILAAMKMGLGLSEHQLRWSAEVLRRYGNVSSPCVIFALENALKGQGASGRWFLSSFGAGIS